MSPAANSHQAFFINVILVSQDHAASFNARAKLWFSSQQFMECSARQALLIKPIAHVPVQTPTAYGCKVIYGR